jgi:hypothetical protein
MILERTGDGDERNGTEGLGAMHLGKPSPLGGGSALGAITSSRQPLGLLHHLRRLDKLVRDSHVGFLLCLAEAALQHNRRRHQADPLIFSQRLRDHFKRLETMGARSLFEIVEDRRRARARSWPTRTAWIAFCNGMCFARFWWRSTLPPAPTARSR